MSTPSPYQTKSDPWSSHTIILKWLSTINQLSKVVEIGTANGSIGKLLFQKHSYKLVGIEVNEQWAEEAKKFYDEIIIADINNVSDEVFYETDCVILADVLEHLPNPEITLKRIIAFLPDESYILISVPNIANIWIRFNLLLGKFNYSDRGILDQTHLRFFTKKTLYSLIDQNQLVIEHFLCSTVPLFLVHPFFEKSVIGRSVYKLTTYLTKLFPTLFGYQLIVKCRKIPQK